MYSKGNSICINYSGFPLYLLGHHWGKLTSMDITGGLRDTAEHCAKKTNLFYGRKDYLKMETAPSFCNIYQYFVLYR